MLSSSLCVNPVWPFNDNESKFTSTAYVTNCVCVCVCFQAQHSHHVIQQVLSHLDTHSKNTPRVRAGIVQVLLETVAIAAKGSIGKTEYWASWFLHGLS